ncbi:MAG: T9SS type A sorting domain-containing protein, partial [Bacteroidota bacterium]|nr:T9SS type A sorting domain-containing protein [Bacteroidota bacterium]
VVAVKASTTGISNTFSSAKVIKTEIFTITGKLVETIKGNQKIPYSSMLKGIYILKQTDVKGNTACSKIYIK